MKVESIEEALRNLLSHPTIASKRWVWKQYDHMVMSGCKIEPGSDAGVVRLSIAGIDKYLAIANDCNNRFCYLDPYKGAQIAFVECIVTWLVQVREPRRLPIILISGTRTSQKLTIYEGMRQRFGGCLRIFRRSRCGGSVSLYNEHGDGAIDPTPVVSMVGLIDEAEHIAVNSRRRDWKSFF